MAGLKSPAAREFRSASGADIRLKGSGTPNIWKKTTRRGTKAGAFIKFKQLKTILLAIAQSRARRGADSGSLI
jgi:hypothetical protein